MGPGLLPETTVSKHNLYHAKKKPYVNMVHKRRRVLWAKAHLKGSFDAISIFPFL